MVGQDEQDKTARNYESTKLRKKRKSRKPQRRVKPRPLDMAGQDQQDKSQQETTIATKSTKTGRPKQLTWMGRMSRIIRQRTDKCRCPGIDCASRDKRTNSETDSGGIYKPKQTDVDGQHARPKSGKTVVSPFYPSSSLVISSTPWTILVAIAWVTGNLPCTT